MMKKVSKKLESTSNPVGGDTGMKVFKDVSAKLRHIYKQKIFPLERQHRFHDLQNPPLEDGEFDAKPTVLMLGQYSTGKSTFIRFLIDADYPGLRVGPEPTTDKFVVVMHGDTRGRDGVVIPGNAVTIDNVMGFKSLAKFGSAFLNRFQVSKVDAKLLECMTFVDTPGILSGSEARLERGYDLIGVLEWFAERVDRILLLFDVHQLDISDELLRCISALRGCEDKVRLVLNKADGIDPQQLVRVYGALMWSLGRVTPAPESARVYIGSFWDEPFRNDGNRRLLEDEEEDLLKDLQSLPKDAAMRRINDLIKRTRRAKIHALIMDHLKNNTPAVFGKDAKKKQLLANLDGIFEEIRKKHNIAARDFPDTEKMRRKLETLDFKTLRNLDPRMMKAADAAMEKDLPKLLEYVYTSTTPKIVDEIKAFDNLPKPQRDKEEEENEEEEEEDMAKTTPFAHGRAEGVDVGRYEKGTWIPWNETNVELFYRLQTSVDGKIGGLKGKKEMQKSKLPNSVLGRIWHLSDVDRDGQLDLHEFLLAKHLIQVKLDGYELPAKLPPHLKPPAKDESAEGAAGGGTVMAPPRWASSVNLSRAESRTDNVSMSGTLKKRNVKGLDPGSMNISFSAESGRPPPTPPTGGGVGKPPRPPPSPAVNRKPLAAPPGATAAVATSVVVATASAVAAPTARQRVAESEERISLGASFTASDVDLDVNSYKASDDDSLDGVEVGVGDPKGGGAEVASASPSYTVTSSTVKVSGAAPQRFTVAASDHSDDDDDATIAVVSAPALVYFAPPAPSPTPAPAPVVSATVAPVVANREPLPPVLPIQPFASSEEMSRKSNVVVVQPQTKAAPIDADIRYIDDEDWDDNDVQEDAAFAASAAVKNELADETLRRHVDEICQTQKEMDKLEMEMQGGGTTVVIAEGRMNKLKIEDEEEEDDEDEDDDDEDEEEDSNEEDDEDDFEDGQSQRSVDLEVFTAQASQSLEKQVETSEVEVQTDRIVKTTIVAKV